MILPRTLVTLLVAVNLSAASLFSQGVTLPEASPAASVSQVVGITRISVDYGRPSVKGREIWGGLVPYGLSDLGWPSSPNVAPWRAGANQNTVISFQHPVSLGDLGIPAGRYGLHMIIRESGGATVIFSRDADSWGSYFYDPKHDALRVDVAIEPAEFTELLTYEFIDVNAYSAVLLLRWADKRVVIPFTVDTNTIMVENLKKELNGNKGFQYQSFTSAATFLLDNDLEFELALEWAEAAISRPYLGQKNKQTLELKARALDKLERPEEAAAARAEAAKL